MLSNPVHDYLNGFFPVGVLQCFSNFSKNVYNHDLISYFASHKVVAEPQAEAEQEAGECCVIFYCQAWLVGTSHIMHPASDPPKP